MQPPCFAEEEAFVRRYGVGPIEDVGERRDVGP
jgi:hypothetical protein